MYLKYFFHFCNTVDIIIFYYIFLCIFSIVQVHVIYEPKYKYRKCTNVQGNDLNSGSYWVESDLWLIHWVDSISCESSNYPYKVQWNCMEAQLPEAIGTPTRGPHNSSNFDRSHFLETVNDSHEVTALVSASVCRQIYPGSEQDNRSSDIF